MSKTHKQENMWELNVKRPYCRIAGKVGVSAHTKALRESLLAKYGTICWICEKFMPYSDRTIDHILPVSLGGKSVLENLKLAHSRCNSFRSSKVHLTTSQIVAQLYKRSYKDQQRSRRSFLRSQWKNVQKEKESQATDFLTTKDLPIPENDKSKAEICTTKY